MRWFSASLLSLCLVSALSSADIRLPDPKLPDPPPPAPMPSAVYQLGADDIYPVESDSPLVIRSYPKGLIKFLEMKPGPHHWKVNGEWQHKEFKGPYVYFGTATGEGRTQVEFFWAEGNAVKTRTATIDCLKGPQPPPPDPPGPKPPDPKPPEPVTSFRVIFVYESVDNLTPAQRGVVFGHVTEEWLNANCTSGKDGWRRRDKDADGEHDTTMAALWAAIKPKITVTPCVAIERNAKVEIISLAATPAEMVKTFQEYKGK